MKRISVLLSPIILLLLIGCPKKVYQPLDYQHTKNAESTVPDELEQAILRNKYFQKYRMLYEDLMAFKNTPNFLQKGFGEGGDYRHWLDSVEKYKNDPAARVLIERKLLFGELEALGLAYVSSKGKETEVTKFFNEAITDALYPQIKEEIKININTKEDELVGQWRVVCQVAKIDYIYAIYKKNDNSYYGVAKSGKEKIEKLIKNGVDYYIEGNKSGEFYRIDNNLNMKLFDKHGDLSSVGYYATKL